MIIFSNTLLGFRHADFGAEYLSSISIWAQVSTVFVHVFMIVRSLVSRLKFFAQSQILLRSQTLVRLLALREVSMIVQFLIAI